MVRPRFAEVSMQNSRSVQWLLITAAAVIPLATAVVSVPAAQVRPPRADFQGQVGNPAERQPVDPLAVAARVDELILAELKKAGANVAPRCSDEDFLRRASFDIAGVSPSPQEVTLF